MWQGEGVLQPVEDEGARPCDVAHELVERCNSELRQYLCFCTSSCVRICTFVLANLETEISSSSPSRLCAAAGQTRHMPRRPRLACATCS